VYGSQINLEQEVWWDRLARLDIDEEQEFPGVLVSCAAIQECSTQHL
jgi:hypothetical protein